MCCRRGATPCPVKQSAIECREIPPLKLAETASSSRPLKTQSAYDMLKRMIITLELPPGASLDERELMERFGIGRTPIREAMLRLSHEGIIVHTPRRGVRVSELSILDLQEMFEARTCIEPLITARAAERATSTDLRHLDQVLSQAEAAVERDDVAMTVECDYEFHMAVAAISSNRYYAAMAQQVYTSMLRYWHVSYSGVNDFRSSFGHHRVLLEAIASGNPERARIRAL